MSILEVEQLEIDAQGRTAFLPLHFENIHLESGISTTEFSGNWKSENRIFSLWDANPDLKLGNMKLHNAKIKLPETFDFSLTLERSLTGSLEFVAFRTNAKPFLWAEMKNTSRVVGANLQIETAKWDKKGLEAKILVEEKRSKWKIPLDIKIPAKKQDIIVHEDWNSEDFSKIKLRDFLEIWPFPFDLSAGKLRLEGNATISLLPPLPNQYRRAYSAPSNLGKL